MQMRLPELCAYCGRPLHLVAGFCRECSAPASVARHQRLIVDSRRHAGLALQAASPLAALPLSETTNGLALTLPGPPPAWTKPLSFLGVVLLATAVLLTTIHLMATAPVPLLLGDTSNLTIAAPGSPSGNQTLTSGTPCTITYAVVVTRASGVVDMAIDAPGTPTLHFSERWPEGAIQRSVPIVPVKVGLWQIRLSLDGHLLHSVSLQIQPHS